MAKWVASALRWGKERWTFALLFLAAILLYLPGIWWGVPHATAPERFYPWGTDELAPVGPITEVAGSLVRSPWYNPQYPLFHYVVQTVFVAPYSAYLWLTGGLSRPSGVYPFGFTDPVNAVANVTILARLASLLMAGGVVLVACRTAQILWDRRTGMIASALVLLLYPMFYYSRTSNVDIGALFWTSLGLAVFALCLRDSLTMKRVVLLGVFAALAIGTKDACYAPFLVIGAVVVTRHLIQHRPLRANWWQACKLPLLGLVASIAVYSVASGLILHPTRYLDHIDFITAQRGWEDSPTVTAPNLEGYLELAAQTSAYIVDAMGTPMAIIALVGLGLCVVRSPLMLTLALVGFAVVLGAVVPVRFVYFRFVFIVAYVLAFFAAHALSTILSSPRQPYRGLGFLLLVIVCGWSALRGADLTHQMIFDSRYELAGWLKENTGPGDRLGYFGSSRALPHLDEGLVTVKILKKNDAPLAQQIEHHQADFLIIVPVQHFEPIQGSTLSKDTYAALLDGSLGYRRVFQKQTPSIFSRRPVSFVNPPVQVFARIGRLPATSGE